MLYTVPNGKQASSRPAIKVDLSDAWLIDVTTGEKRIVQAGSSPVAAAMVGTVRGGRRTAATSPMPKPAATSAGS